MPDDHKSGVFTVLRNKSRYIKSLIGRIFYDLLLFKLDFKIFNINMMGRYHKDFFTYCIHK